MATVSGVQLLAPSISVLINGRRLTIGTKTDLVAVNVSEDLEAPSMFTLELDSWDLAKSQLTWIDDDLFDLGDEVEIQMGYDNSLMPIIVGEITGLEPEFALDTTPSLIVRGHDLRHRLLRGRKTRSFTQMKDSDIARQIARERGLTLTGKDTQVKQEYVLQNNQTDWDFLQDRAKRIGYEVVVENKTLSFREHQNKTQKVLTLSRKEDLIEFSPRLSTMNQADWVKVQGWNPKQKQVIVGTAKVGNETTMMGGSTSGPKAVRRAYGQAVNSIVNQPLMSQAEADQIALGQFNDMALSYITGEGICQGRTDLRAGKVIEITGVGKRFSGLYYVTSTNHSYSRSQGYSTSFTVRRNAT